VDSSAVHHESVRDRQQDQGIVVVYSRLADCDDPVIWLLPKRTPATPGSGRSGHDCVRDMRNRKTGVEQGATQVYAALSHDPPVHPSDAEHPGEPRRAIGGAEHDEMLWLGTG
jgi:hypothetical protein